VNKSRQHSRPSTKEEPILLGFIVKKRGANRRITFSIRWGRIAATFATLAIIGWLTLAGALYFHFKYNKEFEEVAYTEMLTLLPFGLEAHRTKMGNYHVEKGLDAVKKGEYRDGLRLLRLGVARAPGNLEGRSVLAEFYEIALNRPDIAVDLLVEGLELGGIENIDYLKQTFRFLLRHQMDEKIQEIADQFLPETPEINEIYQTIAFAAANANHLRGNYDRADDYLVDYELLNALEGVILSAQISWDRGNENAAIAKLEQSLRRYPNSGPLLIKLSGYHRELDELDEARRYAILRNVSDPLSPAPRLELLYIYNKAGDTEREEREIRRMLQQFSDNESALQALANFAADSGNIELARNVYQIALENEFGVDAFALLLVEAHLVSEDYEGALEFSEELLRERPDWMTDRWGIFNSLRAVASYGLNRSDLGEIYIKDFLNEPSNRPQTYLAVARRFARIDRHEQARQVLVRGYELAPNNQKLLSELIRTNLRLGNTEDLNNLITRLLRMRRPEIDLLGEAYQKLGSDRFIFAPNRETILLQLSAILRERF